MKEQKFSLVPFQVENAFKVYVISIKFYSFFPGLLTIRTKQFLATGSLESTLVLFSSLVQQFLPSSSLFEIWLDKTTFAAVKTSKWVGHKRGMMQTLKLKRPKKKGGLQNEKGPQQHCKSKVSSFFLLCCSINQGDLNFSD